MAYNQQQSPPPQARRAQTYDHYGQHGPSAGSPDQYANAQQTGAGVGRARSLANQRPGMPEGPPLPSYSDLMAAESAHSHTRSPSIEQVPYAPVDYHEPQSNHRLSAGSLRRPVSDPNNIDFSQLSFTQNNPAPVARQNTTHSQHSQYTPSAYPHRGQDGASVYSLDSGMGAYHYARPDYSNNSYYTAASEFVGPPPTAYQAGPSSLMRQNTSATSTTMMSSNTMASTSTMGSASTSSVSLSRRPSEVVGSGRRRAAIDVNKPPYTKQYVDDYRKRMKDDPDPEAQFAFSKYLIEAAKKLGDEISQTDLKLGRRYRDALLQESLRNIKKLAEGKEPYPDAQFFLANLYGTGQLGLQVDHEKAYYLYLMASKLNHPASTYRGAVCNEIGAGTKRDPNRAVLFYRKAAALGDTAAMYKLGMILLSGLLLQPRNPREAIVWLRRAAAQADEDNPHALHELALLHERPNSGVVPHDPNMSRELFLQAAQLGYPPAQFKLGSCHEFGTLGCPIDPRRSIGWYTKAAEKGDSEAELALSGWYLTGSEGVLKQSDTEAYLWGRKAANKGNAKAEYAVGYYTEMGIGVKTDTELAKRWYQRAAAQQHKRAMQRLTELNNTKFPKGKRAPGRPTRNEASSECAIM